MLKVTYAPYTLRFREPAMTSRSTMTEKQTYFIKVFDSERPERFGLGECALFRGLSSDDRPDYEATLQAMCETISRGEPYDVSGWSSIRFGLETAILDYDNGACRTPFPSEWTQGKEGIEINGLVWMGSVEQMAERAARKIDEGFGCIKFKVGAEDFNAELRMLDKVRLSHGPDRLEIRLDANGAFTSDNVEERLRRLSVLDIHSIEQPVKAGQWDLMSWVCQNSPIAVALDEELIGVDDPDERRRLLHYIAPQYVVLKPSLCGGLSGAADWVNRANAAGIGWWVTSALESNVGLNAIAQWTATLDTDMAQGLGTGQLYTNNIDSPLRLDGPQLWYEQPARWHLPELPWHPVS